MKITKKMIVLIGASILGMSTAYALPKMTCSCTKGSMVIEFNENGYERSCTSGGRVHCIID